MSRATCAECDYARTEIREDYWDRWGRAHSHEFVRCMLSGQPNYGHRFSARQEQPDTCSWARILLKQARQAS